MRIAFVLIGAIVSLLMILTNTENSSRGKNIMAETGTFDIDFTVQQDQTAPAGRMLISKQYHGPLSGTGMGQMISKRTGNGTSAYFAIEEFDGSLNGLDGGFTLMHRGIMDETDRFLDVTILEGSGRGQLATVKGSMTISQIDGRHHYALHYDLG